MKNDVYVTHLVITDMLRNLSSAAATSEKPCGDMLLRSQWIVDSFLFIISAFDNIRAPTSPTMLPLPQTKPTGETHSCISINHLWHTHRSQFHTHNQTSCHAGQHCITEPAAAETKHNTQISTSCCTTVSMHTYLCIILNYIRCIFTNCITDHYLFFSATSRFELASSRKALLHVTHPPGNPTLLVTSTDLSDNC